MVFDHGPMMRAATDAWSVASSQTNNDRDQMTGALAVALGMCIAHCTQVEFGKEGEPLTESQISAIERRMIPYVADAIKRTLRQYGSGKGMAS